MPHRSPLRFALPLGVLALALAAPAALAQQSLPETNNAAFAPLALPAPNAYRAANGAPGPDYWQNRADYTIEAALDTTAHRVSGTVTLRYTNNSPLPLDHLWLHLEQNLFAPDSRGAMLQSGQSRWRGAFDEGGFTLGEVTAAQDGERYAPDVTVDDTRMRVDLRTPVAAGGGTVTLAVPYAFVSPEYGADRMGLFEAAGGTVYEFAQWFPRVAVFDDVNGWNAMPYLGQGEFYLDYGDYDVALTVPSNMTVVATGWLQNPEAVWTAEQRARLDRAMAGDEVVAVVAPDEVGRAHPTRAGTTTWRFRAENVRDFAWAASPAFALDATSVDNGAGARVLVLAAYPREGMGTDDEPGWEDGAAFSAHAIGYYGRAWYPYPYPAAVSVAGVVGGMEYPGIQFTDVASRGFDLFATIDHELGHNWFPMIVGQDERRFAWMDEGFNSFLNALSSYAYFDDPAARPTFAAGRGAEAPFAQYVRTSSSPASPGAPSPTSPSRRTRTRRPLGWLAYFKPAFGLVLLREHVLGPERFDAAFREYIERWAFKHPQPADFFRTVEDVSGEDLDWFWRGWFLGTGRFDAAVAAVEAGAEGTAVTFESRGEVFLPLVAEVTCEGGATERVRVPVEAFFLRDTATVGVACATVANVTLDPDRALPDVDRTNDTWAR